MTSQPSKRRFMKHSRKSQDLPLTAIKGKVTRAWFYANRGSIDLVLQENGGGCAIYRFRLRDMRKILEDLS